MANAKPDQRTHARPMIESALRTLDTEAGGIAALLAATTASLSQQAPDDGLAVPRLASGGFPELDSSGGHPSGHVTPRLKSNRDVTHSGAAVPVRLVGTAMEDATIEFTTKDLGRVGI